jgi:hypothetical protein
LISLATAGLLTVAGAAHASTITFTFQPCGNNTCAISDVSKLDWQPGNVLAVGGAGGGAPLPVGTQITDYFQANLGTAIGTTNNTLFSQGDSGSYFTIVAGFREVVSPLSGGSTTVFSLLPGSPNFFEVYYNGVGNGSDLAGTGFANGTLVLSGSITSVFSSVTATSVSLVNGNIVINDPSVLDNYVDNDYPGTTTINTIGGADIQAVLSFVNANFFPDLQAGSLITTALTSSDLGTPYDQTDPSRQFWNGSALIASNIGTRNGITGPNFQFQADAATTFTRAVPEPTSIALIGIAMLGAAAATRRRGRKA